jgi:hypothetical protein
LSGIWETLSHARPPFKARQQRTFREAVIGDRQVRVRVRQFGDY